MAILLAAGLEGNAKKVGMSRGEVADTIERFVEGIYRKWEWDDFCSFPIVDPELDLIRARCVSLPQEYPPTEKGHYCSHAGLEVMRQIVLELRMPKVPD
jgi:hypothetical protein